MGRVVSVVVKLFWNLIILESVLFYVLLQAACSLSVGLGEETLNASSVLVMPMVSSRTTGFRGSILDRSKFIPLRNAVWNRPTIDIDEGAELMETKSLLS